MMTLVKKVIDFLIMAAFGTALYIDCREFAVIERGNSSFGGEVLVPVLVFVVWILIKDAWKTHKEKEARRESRDRRRMQMRYELEVK